MASVGIFPVLHFTARSGICSVLSPEDSCRDSRGETSPIPTAGGQSWRLSSPAGAWGDQCTPVAFRQRRVSQSIAKARRFEVPISILTTPRQGPRGAGKLSTAPHVDGAQPPTSPTMATSMFLCTRDLENEMLTMRRKGPTSRAHARSSVRAAPSHLRTPPIDILAACTRSKTYPSVSNFP